MTKINKLRAFIKKITCSHEWTKAEGYILLHYDICRLCGKLRDTNIENVEFTRFNLTPKQ